MMRFFPFAVLAASTSAFSPSLNNRLDAMQSAVKSPLFKQPAAVTPITTTSRSDMLTQTELPEKIYTPEEKEMPKVLGGVKIGTRKLVCITGASSGLGLRCAETLAKTGRYYVIMACRDVEKAKRGGFANSCSSLRVPRRLLCSSISISMGTGML